MIDFTICFDYFGMHYMVLLELVVGGYDGQKNAFKCEANEQEAYGVSLLFVAFYNGG